MTEIFNFGMIAGFNTSNDCTNIDSETRQHFIKHLTKSTSLHNWERKFGEELVAPFRLRELTFPAAQPVE